MDKLKMHKETIEIPGGRKLYNYTFDLEPNAKEEDSDPEVDAASENQSQKD